MFMQPLPNGAPGISRPFVVAVVLLLLFLSMQTDWSPPRNTGKHDIRMLQADAPDLLSRESTKEKIILDLSISNEKLERDVWQLRQHLMDLRRAARRAGCNLTSTDMLLTFPELEQGTQGNGTAPVVPLQGHAHGHHHLHRTRRAGPTRRLQWFQGWWHDTPGDGRKWPPSAAACP